MVFLVEGGCAAFFYWSRNTSRLRNQAENEQVLWCNLSYSINAAFSIAWPSDLPVMLGMAVLSGHKENLVLYGYATDRFSNQLYPSNRLLKARLRDSAQNFRRHLSAIIAKMGCGSFP